MPSYEDYMSTLAMHEAQENKKKPGQNFCDKFGWRLYRDFNEIQRPDKITYMNGSIYRTQTQTCHIWYQSMKTPNHHVWIEFDGALIYVKIGINVYVKEGRGSSWGKNIWEPDPTYFRDYRTFSDGITAVQYILSTNP